MSEVHASFLGLCLYVSLSLFHNVFVGKMLAIVIVIVIVVFGSMVACRCCDIDVTHTLLSLFLSACSF